MFRPDAGVSCAIVIFTKTNSSGTENVWLYDMAEDGYKLDDKRTPKLGIFAAGLTFGCDVVQFSNPVLQLGFFITKGDDKLLWASI
nr:hypothetical protein [Pacificibacter marinus]